MHPQLNSQLIADRHANLMASARQERLARQARAARRARPAQRGRAAALLAALGRLARRRPSPRTIHTPAAGPDQAAPTLTPSDLAGVLGCVPDRGSCAVRRADQDRPVDPGSLDDAADVLDSSVQRVVSGGAGLAAAAGVEPGRRDGGSDGDYCDVSVPGHQTHVARVASYDGDLVDWCRLDDRA